MSKLSVLLRNAILSSVVIISFAVTAQEIEEVLPEVVTTRGNGFKAVKYEKIVPLLIESIKELKKEVDDIKQKCDCLNK